MLECWNACVSVEYSRNWNTVATGIQYSYWNARNAGMPLFDDVANVVVANYLFNTIHIIINRKLNIISGKETTGINDFNLNNI